jgi:small subunit ribosomal protein S2
MRRRGQGCLIWAPGKTTSELRGEMAEVGIKELLEAGVHFGHQTRRWNPRMRRFIHGERDGIHIIDLLQTEQLLKQAQDFVTEVASKGGVILFVGTKKQARDSIQEWAERCGMPYVNRRWLGGLLTNFNTIKKRIARLHELRDLKEDGRLDLLPTKERMSMEAELRKLEYNLGGVADMQRLPDAVLIIDLKTEEIGLREAARLEIPIIGLVDSNCDPTPVRYVIPGNDDAIRSCDLIVGGLGSSIEGAAATWRAAEEKRRAEEEEKKRREEEERKRREAEEKAKQEAEEKAKAEAEAKARAEAEEKAKAKPAEAEQKAAPQPAEAKQAEANKEAAEERPQPQGEGETKPHNAQGSQKEANREAAIEVPQPPPSDDAEPTPEPAKTKSGGES